MSHLQDQKSPYLLQQAASPVNWYPWGEEAANKAKAEDKLVFLSIGYSSCHWCHVMDRESFGNNEIAGILNEKYVCVRVDREERPDVDRLYMTFVQAANQNGGWPLNVWLTPDLKPIYGCSYLPPDRNAAKGHPSMKSLLKRMATKWTSERASLQSSAESIVHALASDGGAHHENSSAPDGGANASSENGDAALFQDGKQWSHSCFEALWKQYDASNGGFGGSPKFPQPSNLSFLFAYFANYVSESKNEKNAHLARNMALETLQKMAHGGIRDHIGGGFHRYSRDRAWRVPHFEKMLSDQAQLALMYAVAFQVTDDDFYADVCQDTLKYVSSCLSHKSGGFYSSEDADSLPAVDSTEAKEGAFYAWSTDELQKILSLPIPSTAGVTHADVFMNHYNAKIGGNVDPYQDDHCELDGKNVLYARDSLEEAAIAYGCIQQDIRDVLSRSKVMLQEAQKSGASFRRPRPRVDSKIITAWNGLMISAYARSSQALNKSQYAEKAERCAQFVMDNLFDKQAKILLRCCYGEGDNIAQLEKPIGGLVEDYACMVCGLLDLYETVFDEKWLAFAKKLQKQQDKLFWDDALGAYFNTQADDSMIAARVKEEQDGAEPSASSVTVRNLLRLADILNMEKYREQAGRTLKFFQGHVKEVPMALPELVAASMCYDRGCKQIIICGDKEDRSTRMLRKAVHEVFLPDKVLVWVDSSQQWLLKKVEFYGSLETTKDAVIAYVCSRWNISGTFKTADELETRLRNKNNQSSTCIIV